MNAFNIPSTPAVRISASRAGLGSRGLSVPVTGAGVASLQNVTVANRPVTSHQHGLVAVGTSQGAKRRVYDRNSVLAELNTRINETNNEISTVEAQIASINSELNKEPEYRKRRAQLSSETERLSAQLSDINLILDNIENGNVTQVLSGLLSRYQEDNRYLSEKIDSIYDQRKLKESEVSSWSIKFNSMKENLLQMSTDDQFAKLFNTRDQLINKASEAEEVYRQLQSELETVKNRVMSLPNNQIDWIQEYEQLNINVSKMKEEIENSQMTMSPEEEKNHLIKLMKQWNSEVQQLKGEAEKIREQNLELQDQIAATTANIEKKGENLDQNLDEKQLLKYNSMKTQKVDAESFLKTFPQKDKEIVDEIRQKSSQVNTLIAFLIKKLKITSSINPDMLDFDRENNHDRVSTSDVIAQKKNELEHLTHLESAIQTDEIKLSSAIKKMKTEMSQFSDVHTTLAKTQSEKAQLTQQLQYLDKRVSFYKNVVKQLKKNMEEADDALGRVPIAVELSKMDTVFSKQEAKISKYQGYVDQYAELIAFSKVRDQCTSVGERINRDLKTSLL
ncbi:hypothetical protein RCL1_004363 [Eukaryota sp. TZLM3-RCL]